ncbi:phage tail tube protein [Acetobacter sp. A11-2]|uniref:phage tail tube protein n=1 Tax=Acetobacter sp. A11-2 TaxID=3157859 RepID=UPI0038CFDF1F
MAFFIEVIMAFTGATAGLAAGAQTNDTRMDFALESTYATPPTGNYQALRITGESFSRAETTGRPEEINSIKEVSQDVVTQVSASGTISGALSSGTFDDLIAGVMGADWSANAVSMGNPGGDVLHASDSTFMNGVDCLQTADVTSAKKFPATGNLIISDPSCGFVISVPYTKIDTVSVPNAAVFVFGSGVLNSAAPLLKQCYGLADTGSIHLGANSTYFIPSLLNGNLDKTFTIRKKLLGQFLMYPGSLITQVQFQLQQAQFGTVSIDATSANEVQSTTDIAASVLPAPSGVVHNSVNNFLGATVFGKSPQGCLTQFTCTLARDGSANDYGMGHADACGVRSGQFTASGSLEFYFRSWDEYNAALAGTQGTIIVKTVDDAGNGYAFIFLNAALRNGKVNSSQTNQTVKASFDIAGNPATGGGTFAIMRLTGVTPTGS